MLMENPENFFNWKTSWQAKSVAQVLMNTFGNMNLIFAVFLVTVGRFSLSFAIVKIMLFEVAQILRVVYDD